MNYFFICDIIDIEGVIIMNKNDKQKRRDGTVKSANTKMPVPSKSYNTTTSEFEYSDADNIGGIRYQRY